MGQDKGWRVARPGRPAWPRARSPSTLPVAPAAGQGAGDAGPRGDGRRLRLLPGDARPGPQGPGGRRGRAPAPLADASVDVVTIAFGLRNLPEPGQGLLEFRRVLRPGAGWSSASSPPRWSRCCATSTAAT
jgi:demethylmenaquinone methyltransferase/2-methoxy-6-polyprenyl-1,4-benzoquinol methylase